MKDSTKKYKKSPKGRICVLRCRDRHRENGKRKQDALENRKERNDKSKKHATRHYRKWTDAELRMVWNNNYTDAELGRMLGRTKLAISKARQNNEYLKPEGYMQKGDKRSGTDKVLLANGEHHGA